MSQGLNWPVIGLAAVGIAATGVIAYTALTHQNAAQPVSGKKKKGSKKKQLTKSTGISNDDKSSDTLPMKITRQRTENVPSPKEILEKITSSQNALEQSQGKVTDSDKELMEFIRSTEATKWDPSDRIKVGQWMQLYMMLRAMACNSEAEAKELLKGQKNDLPVMWELVNFSDAEKAKLSEEDQHAAEQHKLEVASRMQNKTLLADCFARIKDSTKDDDLPMAFTAAASLGKWGDFRRIATKLETTKGQTLKEFHVAALQSNQVPDFQVLFEVSEGEADAELEDIQWRVFELKSLRTRIKNVVCQDDDTVKQLMELAADWKETPLDNNKITQQGGFARMLSTTEIPVPLIGPMRSKTLKLKGYADLNPADPLRHSEEYDLKLQSTDGKTTKWSGTYVMTQDKVKNLSEADHKKLMELTLECELVLMETDEETVA